LTNLRTTPYNTYVMFPPKITVTYVFDSEAEGKQFIRNNPPVKFIEAKYQKRVYWRKNLVAHKTKTQFKLKETLTLIEPFPHDNAYQPFYRDPQQQEFQEELEEESSPSDNRWLG